MKRDTSGGDLTLVGMYSTSHGGWFPKTDLSYLLTTCQGQAAPRRCREMSCEESCPTLRENIVQNEGVACDLPPAVVLVARAVSR